MNFGQLSFGWAIQNISLEFLHVKHLPKKILESKVERG
jgi:hypothetical protein